VGWVHADRAAHGSRLSRTGCLAERRVVEAAEKGRRQNSIEAAWLSARQSLPASGIVHFEWYVPVVSAHHRYFQFSSSGPAGSRRWQFRLRTGFGGAG